MQQRDKQGAQNGDQHERFPRGQHLFSPRRNLHDPAERIIACQHVGTVAKVEGSVVAAALEHLARRKHCRFQPYIRGRRADRNFVHPSLRYAVPAAAHGKRRGRERKTHRRRLAGAEKNLFEPLQFLFRAGKGGIRLADIQLHDLVRVAPADVADGHLRSGIQDFQLRILELRISQSMPEGVSRRRLLRLVAPIADKLSDAERALFLPVQKRAEISCRIVIPRCGEPAARRNPARQNAGKRCAGFRAFYARNEQYRNADAEGYAARILRRNDRYKVRIGARRFGEQSEAVGGKLLRGARTRKEYDGGIRLRRQFAGGRDQFVASFPLGRISRGEPRAAQPRAFERGAKFFPRSPQHGYGTPLAQRQNAAGIGEQDDALLRRPARNLFRRRARLCGGFPRGMHKFRKSDRPVGGFVGHVFAGCLQPGGISVRKYAPLRQRSRFPPRRIFAQGNAAFAHGSEQRPPRLRHIRILFFSGSGKHRRQSFPREICKGGKKIIVHGARLRHAVEQCRIFFVGQKPETGQSPRPAHRRGDLRGIRPDQAGVFRNGIAAGYCAHGYGRNEEKRRLAPGALPRERAAYLPHERRVPAVCQRAERRECFPSRLRNVCTAEGPNPLRHPVGRKRAQ